MRVTSKCLRARRGPAATPASADADAGFTLIELVVAVAILGIIAVALTGVVIQYLKVTGMTETRLNESSDIQFVSTYWQNDVSSLGRRSFDNSAAATDSTPSSQSIWVDATDGGCGTGVSGGQPVVTFAWNGYTSGVADASAAWNQTTQRVAYVAVPDVGHTDYAIERVWCGSTSMPTITAARHVTSWTVQCDGGSCGSDLPKVVTLKMHVQDKSDPSNNGVLNSGTDVTLTGERRQRS